MSIDVVRPEAGLSPTPCNVLPSSSTPCSLIRCRYRLCRSIHVRLHLRIATRLRIGSHPGSFVDLTQRQLIESYPRRLRQFANVYVTNVVIQCAASSPATLLAHSSRLYFGLNYLAGSLSAIAAVSLDWLSMRIMESPHHSASMMSVATLINRHQNKLARAPKLRRVENGSVSSCRHSRSMFSSRTRTGASA